MKEGVFRRVAIGAGIVLLIAVLNYLAINTSGVVNWVLIFGSMAAMLGICKLAGLTLADIGLGRSGLRRGLIYGGLSVLLVALALGAVFLVRPSIFLDSRYNKSTLDVLVTAFIFIPFHTVLIEELLFRGAIFSYMLKVSDSLRAIFGSAVFFGLWHILPSLGIAQTSTTFSTILGRSDYARFISVAAVVLATFGAGLLLAWLRLRSKSLVAPFLMHWAINALALMLAVFAKK